MKMKKILKVKSKKDIEKQIKELRNRGKKLAEISKITGKSIHYVYSRLNPKYRLGRLEIHYINEKVIPTLKRMGFKDIYIPDDPRQNRKKKFWADIVAKKGKTFHIFEVKHRPQRSLFCFAVGEIILNRCVNNKINGKKKYHIVLPHPTSYIDVFTKKVEWASMKNFKEEAKFLKKNYGVDVIFI